ncbi:helix-turn-helix domain-containing protein [Altererythrobacter sp. ZODW24]|uniref:winged helix-turn-helix transcriptional regulator n=1 Tax=Altererythrobacter sp. ZODW24 TaxID=2185142 RepID=UPI000DF74CFF|nr:helix-turn-helix domain-containing protein [Altererythrobacter sp. ZODW24]
MPSNLIQESGANKLVRTCSIWRALEVLGDVPTLLILESIWLGDSRFEKIKTRTCLSKPLIAQRLKTLAVNGVIGRHLYCEKPPRYEYRLTEKGRALFPVTMMLFRWEKAWSPDSALLAMELSHKECGRVSMPEPMCSHCQQIVAPQDIEWREGPGLGMMEPDYTRRRQHRNRQAIAENLSLFTASAELLGDRWAGLAMRAVFTGLHKFDRILEDSGMASNILSDRLAWLVEHGFLRAALYQTGPDRFAYHATEKSLDYLPVLLVLQRWGDCYYGSEEGPPVILHHKVCGAKLDIYAGCQNCKGELALANIEMRIGE